MKKKANEIPEFLPPFSIPLQNSQYLVPFVTTYRYRFPNYKPEDLPPLNSYVALRHPLMPDNGVLMHITKIEPGTDGPTITFRGIFRVSIVPRDKSSASYKWTKHDELYPSEKDLHELVTQKKLYEIVSLVAAIVNVSDGTPTFEFKIDDMVNSWESVAGVLETVGAFLNKHIAAFFEESFLVPLMKDQPFMERVERTIAACRYCFIVLMRERQLLEDLKETDKTELTSEEIAELPQEIQDWLAGKGKDLK